MSKDITTLSVYSEASYFGGKYMDEDRYEAEVAAKTGSTTAVLLERTDDQQIVMRFVFGDPEWGAQSRQVRVSTDMAEQLVSLLSAELDYSPA